MIPDQLSSAHARKMAECETTTLGTVFHERVMLLELATDLQNWPARNLVFRTALDRAAEDLLKMASEADWRSNGPDIF